MVSYADSVRMEHAPTAPTVSGDIKAKVAELHDDGKVEHELIAAVTSIGHHDVFHPTVARPSEELPASFNKSSTGFLLNNNMLKVQVNQEVIRRDTE